MSGGERPVIGFLTDFGLDGAAATCRGVMVGICRDVQIIDISHTIAKYAIRDGAFVLRSALPFLPVGAHVAVVDPGVGTARRPIAIRTERGDVLIGPDNGLLLPAAERLGGATAARELTNRELWLPHTTATFHGRDIFSPVAAHLAAGTAAFADVGPAVPLETLERIPEPTAHVAPGEVRTEVTYVDSFGNLRLAGGRAELTDAFGELAEGDRLLASLPPAPITVTFAPSFGHVARGESLLYVDSSGDLALADNQGDLAARIGARTGMAVTLSRAD